MLSSPSITGRTDTVKLLLDSGANTELLNKIGKTAVQLGAFVGQHDCVQVINNYFSLSSLQQYSMRLKANGQPRLTPDLTMRLHEMLATTNIHPVKVRVCVVKEAQLCLLQAQLFLIVGGVGN